MSLRQELPASVFTSTWRLTQSSQCSATCGGGWTKGEITCTTADGSVRLGDDLCNPDSRPVPWSSCNTSPCVSSGGSGSGGGILFPSDWLWWWWRRRWRYTASPASLLPPHCPVFICSLLSFLYYLVIWLYILVVSFLLASRLRQFVSSLHSLRPSLVILSISLRKLYSNNAHRSITSTYY